MGDGNAIADASATLLAMLESDVDVSPLNVTLASPERVTDDSTATLGLFLYEITESAHTSTVERQDVDPSTVRGGPVSVDLNYLLTAYPGGDGTDNDQAERQHKVLGEAMQALRDNAVIRGSDLPGSLEGELRIVQSNPDAEVMDLWSTFSESGYLPSVPYGVGPVTIRSEAEATVARVTDLEHRSDENPGESP